MKMEERRQQSGEAASINGGDFKLQNASELSDNALLACVYVGSIGGAVGGCLITRQFLGGLYPTAFGMLGCMIGTYLFCAMASFWTYTFGATHLPQTLHSVSGSMATEKVARQSGK
jgi:uncharacterized membrane protein YeaQ/YmgE (transglycosylase-associated protein family)